MRGPRELLTRHPRVPSCRPERYLDRMGDRRAALPHTGSAGEFSPGDSPDDNPSCASIGIRLERTWVRIASARHREFGDCPNAVAWYSVHRGSDEHHVHTQTGDGLCTTGWPGRPRVQDVFRGQDHLSVERLSAVALRRLVGPRQTRRAPACGVPLPSLSGSNRAPILRKLTREST